MGDGASGMAGRKAESNSFPYGRGGICLVLFLVLVYIFIHSINIIWYLKISRDLNSTQCKFDICEKACKCYKDPP